MKTIIKFICIILAALLAVGLISNIITTPEDEPSGSGGSSVIPDQEEKPVGFDITNWHVADHEDMCNAIITCPCCHTEYENLREAGLSYMYQEYYGWGSGSIYYCSCGEQLSDYYVHCYVNGVCHDCGYMCDHSVYYLDYTSNSSLPDGHPIQSIDTKGESNNYPYTDTYIVDGVCQLCGSNA